MRREKSIVSFVPNAECGNSQRGRDRESPAECELAGTRSSRSTTGELEDGGGVGGRDRNGDRRNRNRQPTNDEQCTTHHRDLLVERRTPEAMVISDRGCQAQLKSRRPGIHASAPRLFSRPTMPARPAPEL